MFHKDVPARRICATFTRVDIGSRVAGIVTSANLTLVHTHYLNGRRWMCLGDSCPLCEVISNSRVYGYFSYARASGSKHDWGTAAARQQERILELPHLACAMVEAWETDGNILLGSPFLASRFSDRKQSPVEIQFVDYLAPLQVQKTRLDVQEALLTLHGYPSAREFESGEEHLAACVSHVRNEVDSMALLAGGGHLSSS